VLVVGALGADAVGGFACGACAAAGSCTANSAASARTSANQVRDLGRREILMIANHLVRPDGHPIAGFARANTENSRLFRVYKYSKQ
jgi:hypothetical protein